MSLFLTATDTGVGKTHTAVQILRLARAAGIRCAGMKPICCGDRDDAARLLAASSEGLTIDQINPVWLKTPAAPLTASRIELVKIDVDLVLETFADLQKRIDLVVVEGVGGWLVPIREDFFISDLAAAMGLPVLVVAPNRLGCINHTLLTVRSITAEGSRCAGVMLNDLSGPAGVASTTNAEILSRVIEPPLLTPLTTELAFLPDDWGELFSLRNPLAFADDNLRPRDGAGR
ncbi:MAG: dethiobiotin synthase [Chthoniobacterales bacterium]